MWIEYLKNKEEMLEIWKMARSNQIKYNEIVRWMIEIEKQTKSEQKEVIVKEQAKKVKN